MVLGIAATAMPFARTRAAEAERWLRVLRLHGEAGIVLQSLGVSEMSLPEHPPDDTVGAPPDGDAVARVTKTAVASAARRKASGVSTADLLIAVMEVYGEDFDRVLGAHGADRDEVLERLEAKPTA